MQEGLAIPVNIVHGVEKRALIIFRDKEDGINTIVLAQVICVKTSNVIGPRLLLVIPIPYKDHQSPKATEIYILGQCFLKLFIHLYLVGVPSILQLIKDLHLTSFVIRGRHIEDIVTVPLTVNELSLKSKYIRLEDWANKWKQYHPTKKDPEATRVKRLEPQALNYCIGIQLFFYYKSDLSLLQSNENFYFLITCLQNSESGVRIIQLREHH